MKREDEESPQEVRERAASAATPQGNSRPRARGGWNSKPTNAPAGAVGVVENPQAGQLDDRGEFRLRLKALDQLLILEATRGTGCAKTICGVVIFGLDHLQDTPGAWSNDDVAALNQSLDKLTGTGLGEEAESVLDFAVRWRDAMLATMGADEVLALALLGGEPHHERPR